MQRDSLISVVIPSFNQGNYLKSAIQSVADQGVAEVQVIIVDDASTDDSADVAESLAIRRPDVQLMRHDMNKGSAAARNTGLAAARGRYVCFLDADDTYAPGFFGTALPALESTPRMAAFVTGIELIDCPRDVHPLQMKAVVLSSPSNLLIRKSVADLLGGLPESPAFRGKAGGEDAVFRRALATFFHVAYCQHKFLRYLIRPGNHLNFFLDRSSVVDGKLVFHNHTPEEQSRAAASAARAYFEEVRYRLGALKCLNSLPARPAN